MIRAVYGKPGEGMTYAEASQLSTPSTRPGLRLLCLLVQTRNGETRSLPVHTMRPMPPRVCAADSHTADGLRRWNLEASAFGMEGGTGLYLREAHATRPTAEVLERYLRLGQANALRPDSRTVRAGGVKPTAPRQSRTGQGPRSRLVGSRFIDPANGSTGGAHP